MKTYEKMEKKLKLPKSERSALSVAEFMAKYKIPNYYTALAWMMKKAAAKGLKLKTAKVRRGTRGPPATVFWTVKGGKAIKEAARPKRKYTRRAKVVEGNTPVPPPGTSLAEVLSPVAPVQSIVPGSVNAEEAAPVSFLKRYAGTASGMAEVQAPVVPPVGEEQDAGEGPADAMAIDYRETQLTSEPTL